MATNSKAAKRKTKRPKLSATEFTFHSVPREDPHPQPEDRTHQHLRFDTGVDGRLGSNISFFQAPASPEKRAPPLRWVDTLYEEPPPDEDPRPDAAGDPADPGFIDPDYVSFLNEITLEPLPRKRRRPRSVRGF